MNVLFAIMLIISFLLYSYLCWRNFRIAIFMLVALLPTYLIRFSIGPIPTTALEIFFFILTIVWLTRQGFKNLPIKKIKRWWSPILLLLASATFGTIIAPDLFDALGIWKAYYIEPIIIGLILISTLKKNDWIELFGFLSIGAMVITIFGIFQFLTKFGIPTPWDIELRITSFFDYPNALGLFLAPIIGINIVMLLTKTKLPWIKNKYNTIFWMISAIFCMVGIALAETEAAFIAIPVGLTFTLMISNVNTKTKLRITSETILLFLIAFITIPIVQQKVLLKDYSGQVRISQWTESIDMLFDNPVFGAGLNAYPAKIKSYHDNTLYEIFQYPHNIILNIWSELGILGIIAFVWLIILIIIETKKQKKNPVALAIFSALTIMIIHGLVDVPFFKNDLAIMTSVILAGLIVKK